MTRPRRPRRGGVDAGPRPLAESLDDVVGGLAPPGAVVRGAPDPATRHGEGSGAPGPPSAEVLGTVFSKWAELVGPAVARHTRPLRLTGATLVVAVDQPPWATQVRMLAPGILARLYECTGDRLDHLEVIVRPLT